MSSSRGPLLAWALALPLALGIQFAWADIALVTGRQSSIQGLGREEATQLYLGHRATLANGQAAVLIDLPPGPVRDAFYLDLTGKNPAQIRAYWSRQVFTGRALPPRQASGMEEILRWLAEGRASLAYLPMEALDPRVRVLLTLPAP